ncbi:MAG: hypothetical protein PVG51_12185 [Desulfosarcina sp.]|jgi:hypothetical protein
MGTIDQRDGEFIYRQDDGEITARFDSVEEKMVLSHEGSRLYKRVFNLLVLTGGIYLIFIFFLT